MLEVASLKPRSSMETGSKATERPCFDDTGSGDQSLDGDFRGQAYDRENIERDLNLPLFLPLGDVRVFSN